MCIRDRYDGEQKIKGTELSELNAAELGVLPGDGTKAVVQKYRDLFQQCIIKEDGRQTYILLGLENQSEIHYAMPVRNMIYDALNYGRQVQQIAKQHRKEKDVKGAEFLSGMKKTDKLMPVITLTLYWGAGHWDGPRSLHEMLEAEGHILDFVGDYKLNLVAPGDVKDFSKFQTELGLALEFIASSEDKEALEKLEKDKRYASVSAETVHLLNACTGGKIGNDEKGEKDDMVNMCKGFIELREMHKMEGKVEAYADTGMALDAIAAKLGISLEKVEEILQKSKEAVQ